ncbi:hypothetical protein PSU4_04450 [Pseudonocardia sulfidoxydans NBRC 16205]|uniref:Uncharacterized protein n=1 Tax=Pseudonocardia sulfidoxydans NBRC 16205 TaxID=1223511 RepID=A0A511D9N8_9PSEU|nr:hypothetical protein PSU4_04450 [Pseudonocardia sulfidoxydans NBRC 16205]
MAAGSVVAAIWARAMRITDDPNPATHDPAATSLLYRGDVATVRLRANLSGRERRPESPPHSSIRGTSSDPRLSR